MTPSNDDRVKTATEVVRELRGALQRLESMDLASSLRDERRRQGVEAKEIAAHLGVTPQYFSDLETGRRSLLAGLDRLEAWIAFLTLPGMEAA